MPNSKPVELTDEQFALLQMLSTQRVANLVQLVDLIGDMNHDGLEFLRRLGDPRYEAMTKFLAKAEPQTFEFLAQAQDRDITTLNEGLRLVSAFQLVGRVMRVAIITVFGTFVGMTLIWDKVSIWLKGR